MAYLFFRCSVYNTHANRVARHLKMTIATCHVPDSPKGKRVLSDGNDSGTLQCSCRGENDYTVENFSRCKNSRACVSRRFLADASSQPQSPSHMLLNGAGSPLPYLIFLLLVVN